MGVEEIAVLRIDEKGTRISGEDSVTRNEPCALCNPRDNGFLRAEIQSVAGWKTKWNWIDNALHGLCLMGRRVRIEFIHRARLVVPSQGVMYCRL